MTNTPSGIATRNDGSTIAYHYTSGKSPGVMFMPGFMSDMNGTKAIYLENYCRAEGQAFLRFDYQGHGQSSGAFEDGTIGSWADDAIFALDTLCQGPQVLVGSSMGGWIMLLAALKRPQRVAALLGIAAAPDFTEDMIENQLTPRQRQIVMSEGKIQIPGDYSDEPYTITKKLLEDGSKNLLLRKTIPLTCPVRLIHGMKDDDVPWQTSIKLSQMLASDDVEVNLVKNASHSLSEPDDLQRLSHILHHMMATLSAA